MLEAMLTTIDNPHDPFDDFDAWFTYDTQSGYHTASYLARIVATSDELSDSDQNLAITQAIDEVIKENQAGLYVKVTRDIPMKSLSELAEEIPK